MNYAPRNNVTTKFQSSRYKSGVSMSTRIILVVIVVLTVLYLFLPRTLPTLFLSLVKPVWKMESDARLGATTIEELRAAYYEFQAHAERDNALLEENRELKASLGREAFSRPLLGVILKKPPYSAYDSFILDVGDSQGVKEGQRVYTLHEIPIGEIVEVMRDTSRVKLYSSSGEKFDILIGPQHIEATAIGKGGGSFEVELPRDTKIEVGDSVHIPTLSNSFVGQVGAIVSEPSEPFAQILFRQPVNIYEQRFVIVDTYVSN